MVTVTFDMLGLMLASVVIFAGLVIPMANSEGDNLAGIAYAACIVILSAMICLMIVGLTTLVG